MFGSEFRFWLEHILFLYKLICFYFNIGFNIYTLLFLRYIYTSSSKVTIKKMFVTNIDVSYLEST